jgi:hypothetical protein
MISLKIMNWLVFMIAKVCVLGAVGFSIIRVDLQHKTALPKRSKFHHDVAFQTQNSAQIINLFPLLYASKIPLLKLYLVSSAPLLEGRNGTAWGSS